MKTFIYLFIYLFIFNVRPFLVKFCSNIVFICRGWKVVLSSDPAMQNPSNHSLLRYQQRMVRLVKIVQVMNMIANNNCYYWKVGFMIFVKLNLRTKLNKINPIILFHFPSNIITTASLEMSPFLLMEPWLVLKRWKFIPIPILF